MNEMSTPGTAVYSRGVLSVYDLFVLGFSNTFAWRCPSRRILSLYDRHVSDRHLEVGPGTGYFLDRCRFPGSAPSLTLLDLNRNSLEAAAQRLARYRPHTIQADVLQPWPPPTGGCDSIGLGYLLHCLPGVMADKAVLFRHLRPWLNSGGVVFGTTILGRGVSHNPLARLLMGIYNQRGIFSNREDDAAGLEDALKAHFTEYDVEITGCVAMFTALAER